MREPGGAPTGPRRRCTSVPVARHSPRWSSWPVRRADEEAGGRRRANSSWSGRSGPRARSHSRLKGAGPAPSARPVRAPCQDARSAGASSRRSSKKAIPGLGVGRGPIRVEASVNPGLHKFFFFFFFLGGGGGGGGGGKKKKKKKKKMSPRDGSPLYGSYLALPALRATVPQGPEEVHAHRRRAHPLRGRRAISPGVCSSTWLSCEHQPLPVRERRPTSSARPAPTHRSRASAARSTGRSPATESPTDRRPVRPHGCGGHRTVAGATGPSGRSSDALTRIRLNHTSKGSSSRYCSMCQGTP